MTPDALAVDPAGASLLERESALAEIGEALVTARDGDGAVVFVVGAAGIGKTSVLEAARQMALSSGVRVASGVGTVMESGLPFGLIGQAMVGLGGSAFDDAALLQRLGGQPARLYRILRSLVDAAGDRQLLLAVDDLHWADPDSLQLLGFLCRRLAGSRIVVVGCVRPEPSPASELARELVGAGCARMLELRPLSRDASATLLARTAQRSLDAGETDRLWRACAGTPLLLEAAAWQLGDGGPLTVPSSGAWGTSFLLKRFVGLDQDAFVYVQAASILGVRFGPALAGALAGLGDAAARAAHGRLVRAALLEDLTGGWSRFVHPLFAQALIDAQPLSERERRHAEAFGLLVERGDPDALAAEHAVAARLVGDPRAIRVLANAGRQALSQGALQAASAHFANAVALSRESATDELLLDYASALAARAQIDEAEGVCRRLLERAEVDPAVRARTLALLARVAMVAIRPADAERLSEEAAAAAGLVSLAAQGAVLADAAVTCAVTSPVDWTLATASRALAMLPAKAPVRRTLELLRACMALIDADPESSEWLNFAARDWSNRTDGDPGWAWTVAVHAVTALKLLEQPVAATELFEREFNRAVEDGAPVFARALALGYADVVYLLGRPAEALELVQSAVALGDWPTSAGSHVALAVLLTELGRDDDARPHITALRSLLAGIAPRYYAQVALWLGLLDARRLLAAGEPGQASETMLQAARIAEQTGWRHPCLVPWAPVGIDAHFAAGQVDRARTLIEDLECLSKPLACRWPAAVVALGRARLAAATGQTKRADEQFEAALAMFAALPMPIHHAEALISCGSYLRRSGRPRQARTPLARSLELSERARSERVARLARAELAAAGGRRRRREEDRSKLTAQEQRVAALAADGMSNAKIAATLQISPKTVGHHLQHVYAKLGIGSRHELTPQYRDQA